jgi:GNAT superfamily N-acetyltransferase
MNTIAFDRTATPALASPAEPLPITIRRVRAADALLFGDFVKDLSLGSRQRRFHIGLRELPAEWLQRMTRPDTRRELVLLATVPQGEGERCVGEARYVVSEAFGSAREFALAVADGWQGQGLGRALLRSLDCHAARSGVEQLVGEVLRDNLPMLDLARSLQYDVKRHPQDPRLLLVQRSFSALPLPRELPCAALPFALAGGAAASARRA